jgi:hypothetical protein
MEEAKAMVQRESRDSDYRTIAEQMTSQAATVRRLAKRGSLFRTKDEQIRWEGLAVALTEVAEIAKGWSR